MGDLTMLHREVHADMIRLISHTCNHPCCAEHRVIDTAKPIATDCKVQATLYHAKLSGTDKASFDVHVHGFELILIIILMCYSYSRQLCDVLLSMVVKWSSPNNSGLYHNVSTGRCHHCLIVQAEVEVEQLVCLLDPSTELCLWRFHCRWSCWSCRAHRRHTLLRQ